MKKIINYFLGSSYIFLGIAVGLTASLMMITNSIHPPAGASPIVIILNNITFETALISSMSSSIFLVIFAIIFNSYCLKKTISRLTSLILTFIPEKTIFFWLSKYVRLARLFNLILK